MWLYALMVAMAMRVSVVLGIIALFEYKYEGIEMMIEKPLLRYRVCAGRGLLSEKTL